MIERKSNVQPIDIESLSIEPRAHVLCSGMTIDDDHGVEILFSIIANLVIGMIDGSLFLVLQLTGIKT